VLLLGLFNAKTKNMAWDIYGAKKLAFSCQSKLWPSSLFCQK